MAIPNISGASVAQDSSAVEWMSKDLVIVTIVFYVIILAVSVMGNFLVIFAIIHDKKLQTTCYFLLLHLAVSDITLAIVGILFRINALVNDSRWKFGHITCKLFSPLATVFYISGALILTVISLDRYRAFVQPFKSKLRRPQAKKLIAVVYVFSFVAVVPHALKLQLEGDRCFENWARFAYRQLYTVFLFSVQYALPLIIMFVVYSRIARHLRRPVLPLYANRKRCEREREARNKKALKTIIIVVIVFSVFMMPYQVLWLAADFRGMDYVKLSKLADLFAIFSYIGSCTLNPFIYGVGDRQFRKSYQSFFNHLIGIAADCRRNLSANSGIEDTHL